MSASLLAVDLGVDSSAWPWIWLGLAAVLAIAELLAVPGSFLVLPWAGSSFLAALFAFGGVRLEFQMLIFALGGAIMFAILFRWGRRFTDDTETPVGFGAERLVGAQGVVTVAVDAQDPDRLGRVTLDGESWGAITEGPQNFSVGDTVEVREVRGTRVVVGPVQLHPTV